MFFFPKANPSTVLRQTMIPTSPLRAGRTQSLPLSSAISSKFASTKMLLLFACARNAPANDTHKDGGQPLPERWILNATSEEIESMKIVCGSA